MPPKGAEDGLQGRGANDNGCEAILPRPLVGYPRRARGVLTALRVVGRFWFFLLIALCIGLALTASPPTPAELAAQRERDARDVQIKQAEKQREQIKRFLCLEAKACKKYSEARLECATAGNFKTCLRIKMGEDSSYSDMCSGYDVGAPAVPLPRETPNAVECFFLTFGE
jgi:hypothetical protein